MRWSKLSRRAVNAAARFWDAGGVTALVGGAATFAGAAGAALQAVQPVPPITLKVLIGGAVLSLVGVVLGVSKEVLRSRRLHAQDFASALHAIHASAAGAGGVSGAMDDLALRSTLHLVDGDEFVQLLDYLGGDAASEGTAGREQPIQCGVAGRAVREVGEAWGTWNGTDLAQFRAEMVRSWSFTQLAAAKLRSDRRSWYAIAILGEKRRPELVVFLDSNNPDFFTEPVKFAVREACKGMSIYARRRNEGTTP